MSTTTPETPASAPSFYESLYSHPYEQDIADAHAEATEEQFRSILGVDLGVDSPTGITDLTEKLRDPNLEVRAHAERSLTSLTYDMQNPNTRDKDRPDPEFYPVAALAFDNLSPERYKFSRDALAPTELNKILSKIKAGLDAPDGLEYLPLTPDQYVIAHELLEKAAYVALEDEHKKVDHTLRLEAIWGDKKLLENEDAQKVYLGLVNKAFEEFTIQEKEAEVNGKSKEDDAAELRKLIEAKNPGIFDRAAPDSTLLYTKPTATENQIRNKEDSDPKTAHIIPPEKQLKDSGANEAEDSWRISPFAHEEEMDGFEIGESRGGKPEAFDTKELSRTRLVAVADAIQENIDNPPSFAHLEDHRRSFTPSMAALSHGRDKGLVVERLNPNLPKEDIESILLRALAVNSRDESRVSIRDIWNKSFEGEVPEEIAKIQDEIIKRLEFVYKKRYQNGRR